MGLALDWLALWLQRHPSALRASLSALKRVAPAAVSGKLLTDAAAVREVFERPADFWMGLPNERKLKAGKFLLGMDPGPQHTQEKAVLQLALDHALADLPALVSYHSERAALQLLAAGTEPLDFASSFAEPVFARTLARYFGVPLIGLESQYLDSTDPGTLFAWMVRTLGATIGSAHPAPFGLEELACRVAPELTCHVARALRAHRDGTIRDWLEPAPAGVRWPDAEATVLGQLARTQPFEDGGSGCVRSVVGMLSASAGFPKAFTHAVHELLRHRQLHVVAAAAASGDDARVQAYVREALRFRPVFPLLVRHCPHQTTLGQGAARVALDAGTDLTFFPGAAMFDPAVVPEPEQFLAGRPAEAYWIFGGAPRACIAEQLIMTLFMPMLRALLQQIPALAEAEPGEFRYDSAGVELYALQLSAAGAQAPARGARAVMAAVPRADAGAPCPLRPGVEPATELPANPETNA